MDAARDAATNTGTPAGTNPDSGTGTGTVRGVPGTVEPSDAPTVGTILLAVEELWPESLAEEWDEVGLVAGHPSAEVTRILFAVDPTLEVIEEAIDFGAELLISHHPLLLKGVTSVAANTAKGKAVHRLIESGTSLLTVHTNGDSAVGGVSDVLADALGLQDVAPLTPEPEPEPGRARCAGCRAPSSPRTPPPWVRSCSPSRNSGPNPSQRSGTRSASSQGIPRPR